MINMRFCAVAVMCVTAMMAGASAAATPQQIAAGFVDGTGICLEASLRGVAIKALPAEFKTRDAKAPESARFMTGSRNTNGPIWTVNTAPGNVLISEAAAGDCEVISFGPPVDDTLKQASTAIVAREPAFTDAGDKPDSYTPIRYGLRHGGVHVILEGAEPGTVPGRYFRFSTLSARFLVAGPPA